MRRRLGAMWKGRRWRCKAEGCLPDEGCDSCQVYRCKGCKRLRPWCDGGDPGEECDACWAKADRKRTGKPAPKGKGSRGHACGASQRFSSAERRRGNDLEEKW